MTILVVLVALGGLWAVGVGIDYLTTRVLERRYREDIKRARERGA